MTLILHTADPDDTAAVARHLADLAEAGDLILLVGDLGAGKTAFAQGFGAALGVQDRITSPTFTLVNEHEGRLRLYHLDVYRLEELGEVEDLALAEMLDEEAVVLIEWGDTILPALPSQHLRVRLTQGPGDHERYLELEASGLPWERRWSRLEHLLRPWSTAPGEDSAETPGGVPSC